MQDCLKRGRAKLRNKNDFNSRPKPLTKKQTTVKVGKRQAIVLFGAKASPKKAIE